MLSNIIVKTSVDAGTADVYQKIKGRDRYNAVWDNLNIYSKAGPGKVIAKYIAIDMNSSLEQIEGFLNQCENAKISMIEITPNFSEVWKKEITQASLFAAAKLAYLSVNMGFNLRMDTGLWGSYEETLKDMLRVIPKVNNPYVVAPDVRPSNF